MTAKATELADNAGVSLGDLVYISESFGASPRAFDMAESAASMRVMLSYNAADTPISGGELGVTITVQGVFDME